MGGAFRTDLALESAQIMGHSPEKPLPGVESREEELLGYRLTRVSVTSAEGARLVGKPEGRYLTLELGPLFRGEPEAFSRGARAVAQLLRELLPAGMGQKGEALVVGLGNRMVTPDAVGPRSCDHVLVTRHLLSQSPGRFDLFRPVAALSPGVLGTTGVETGDLLAALVRDLRPACLIAIDALAARSVHRLCTTLQMADTGIIPGSGIGNSRRELSRATLGLPVLAVGVPTVVDGQTLAADLTGGQLRDRSLSSVLVTSKDIDSQITDLAKLIGFGLDLGLQEGLELEDIELLLS